MIQESMLFGGGNYLKKIMELIRKNWDIVSYLFFGVLTTIVSWAVYAPMYHWTQSGVISNVVSWIAAVAFAYLTNKPFVFRSHDWSAKTVIPELTKFVGCRVGSGIAETSIIAVTVDWLGWSGMVMKLATSVLVVVLNYVGSKLLVFRSK